MVHKNYYTGVVDIEKIKKLIEQNNPTGPKTLFYNKVYDLTGIDITDPIRQSYSKSKRHGFSVPVLYALSKGLNCTMEDLLIIKDHNKI